MTTYFLRRLLGLIPVLFGISLLVFSLTRVIPADPALILLGERATDEARAQLREEMGLNLPLFPISVPTLQKITDQEGNSSRAWRGSFGMHLQSQYTSFMGQALRGDFGKSFFTQIPVLNGLATRFPATFELTIFAMLIAVLVGVPLGVIAALNRGTWLDTSVLFIALSGVSFPVFWLAIILMYIFSVQMNNFLPSIGRLDTSLLQSFEPLTNFYVLDGLLRGRLDITGNAIKHLILPAVALGTIPLAIVVRMTRSAMLDVLGQDYIRTAKAKGMKKRRVVNKHALRNALLPVVTVVGLSFGSLLSGAILTETVFTWPGIGKWVYDAIQARDYPVIQGGVLFVATIFVLVNLLVDMSYALIDPRIQYS